MLGWLINDQLTGIPDTTTLWHDLLDWIPDLVFRTGGYTDYRVLADQIEGFFRTDVEKPRYIIRNASYFRTLDLPVPTISFVQDILGSEEQLRVIERSHLVVFNSIFTRSQFRSFDDSNSRIIPIGIDTNVFAPMDKEECRLKHGILPDSIVWVGACSAIKGYDILRGIIDSTPYNYCIVSKDTQMASEYLNYDRVRVLSRISMKDIAEVYNACNLLLCTSRTETQHLVSLEALACGIPVVSPPCGVWYDTESGIWGVRVDQLYSKAIEDARKLLNTFRPREFIMNSPYTKEACRRSWLEVYNDIIS